MDVLLGALEEIRTPDLLIRSQTLYPTELPAQVQDIYYHRPRGLSTVFAKKFKIFFAKQKKVLLPPSGGGPRALFSPADGQLARAALRPGVPLCGLRCPVHSAVPPCGLRCPHAPLRCPLRALGCPVRPGMPCAACGAPMRPAVPPCALGCPVCPGVSPCVLRFPHALWGAPCPLWGCPVCSSVFSVRPCSALRASVSLAAHHAPQYRARLSPPRGGPLSRTVAALCPAPPHGREKARPLQKERPGLVHFAVRR